MEPSNAAHLGATQFGHLFGMAAPDREAMALGKPVLAKLAADQTRTAGQQNVHESFLV
ncbi:hypothetical protein AK972_5014 [Pseudomonas yamanorum]|nr:hypothetical protein AK972_5014 [Pseudomonas yamanorum]